MIINAAYTKTSNKKLIVMHKLPVPKILILKSQMIIAADIFLQFSKLGYDVIGINTCLADALKTIENNRPDIIVMNIQFQGKAEGLNTARTFLEMLQIPVVFISANTGKEIFKSVITAKPFAFISKPFEKKDLQRGIETALNRIIAEGLWAKNKSYNPLKHPMKI